MAPSTIRHVAVIGTGAMGPGIAMCFAAGGSQLCNANESLPILKDLYPPRGGEGSVG